MIEPQHHKTTSAIFITFSGNCKKALTFYQTCFGGQLQFETFEGALADYRLLPVVSGSLVADRITIYGSDLVHNEGRKVGNYISIFLPCKNIDDRSTLIKQLAIDQKNFPVNNNIEQKLVEITDVFDVRWVLSI